MVVDTSAIMAILLDEPERDTFLRLISTANSVSISAGTLIEMTSVALGRGGPEWSARVDALLSSLRIQVRDIDAGQTEIARNALLRFGKGRHPARLNIGDTFSYALAMHLGEPLLFKGDDFPQTDVTPAV